MFDKFAFDTFLKSLENIQHGSFEVISPEGHKHIFQGKHPGPKASIRIYDYSVITNLAAKGDIGFAEDYRDGKWDSDDLPTLVYIALKNESALNSYIYGTNFYKILAKLFYFFRSNTLNGSKRNIQAHYDLGNDFYSLWLDPTMTYSSAIFSNDNESLSEAQHNKYDRILKLIGDKPGDILEIGCGWGGFCRARNNH
jgi:cyclopropane-fatty-acyl-phospholipid synthase